MQEPVYKRVLLKISGEALAGDKHFGLNFDVIGQVCEDAMLLMDCIKGGQKFVLVRPQ
jgi:uridylate kinase